MAQLAQAALIVAGSYFGGPIGAAAAAVVGNALFAPDVEGPRLKNTTPDSVQYGWPIPRIYGRRRKADAWKAWQSPLIETKHEQAAKGGPTQTSYTYATHSLWVVCERPPDYIGTARLLRVWVNKKLEASFLLGSSSETIANSIATEAWGSITLFDGNPEQLPWSVYEAIVGPEEATAYRQLITVGIERLEHGFSESPPLVEFEVCSAGSQAFTSVQTWLYSTANNGDLTWEPGSIDYSAAIQTIPIKQPNRFAYITGGVSFGAYFASEAAAVAQGEADGLAFTGGPFTEFRGVIGTRAISTTQEGGSISTTYVSSFLYVWTGPPENPDLGETFVQSYQFAVQYSTGLPFFEAADAFEGKVTTRYVQLELTNESTSNNGILNRGSSDEPFVSVIYNGDGVTQALAGVTSAQLYDVGGSANGSPYVRRGGVTYMGRGTFTTSGNLRVLKFLGGAASAQSESFDSASGSGFRLAANDDEVFVLWSGADITRLDASDMSTIGTIELPTPAGSAPRIFCDSHGDLFCFTAQRLHRWGGSAWAQVLDVTGSAFDELLMFHPPGYEGGTLYATQTVTAPTGRLAWQGLASAQLVDPDGVPLSLVCRAEMERAGLTSGQFDVSALDEIVVDGYETIQSARQSIEALMPVYKFDWVCSDELRAVLLTGSPVRTIPFEDLGAGIERADPEAFNPERANDQEVAAKHAITVYNLDDDHANLTVYSDLQISESTEVRRTTIPVVLTPARAQGVVDSIAAVARVESVTAAAALTDKHADLECTDIVRITDEDGTLYTQRITRDTYAQGVHKFETVLHDSTARRDEGVTFDGYTPTIEVSSRGGVDLVLLDTALLRDADNVPGFWAAFDLRGGARGARLLRSTDDVEYGEVLRCSDDAIVGTTTAVLLDSSAGYRFDEVNRLHVAVSGPLSGTTRAGLQADRTLNTIAVGAHGRWEIIRFRDATFVETDEAGRYVYVLRGLLRGQRGTEHATASHQVADTVVLLRAEGLRSVEQSGADVGLERYWKAVADGRRASSSTGEAFAPESERLKPWASVRPRIWRDASGNAEISFTPRTRQQPRYGGTGGSYVPAGESIASYEIEVYSDATFSDLVDTLTGSTTAISYGAAAQTAAGLAPGDPLNLRIYRLSAIVGRGHALEVTQ